MKGPNSHQECHILQASQALGGHYFSLGFHPFLYTVLYTDKFFTEFANHPVFALSGRF
jgi:hypothetical protein